MPIFVVGFQRSGTTLLQGLLGAHPDVAAAPETHYFFRIHDLRDYYGDLGTDEVLRQVVHDLLHPPIPLLDDCGFDEDAVFARIRARGATYATVLDELLLDFAERQGASRWSEKSPGQPLSSILSLFPDAQILHITRDPVDVIASSLDTSWNDRSVEELAGRWRRFEAATGAAAAGLPATQYLPVRYEALVSQPAAELSTICHFLGIDARRADLADGDRRLISVPSFADRWLWRVGHPIDTRSIGRGRQVLSAAQQAAVQAIIDADPPSAPASAVGPAGPSLTPAHRYERTQRFFAELADRCAG